jgi:hypothetical protein
MVADFLEAADKEYRAIIMRRYEKVNNLLDKLKIYSWEEKAS